MADVRDRAAALGFLRRFTSDRAIMLNLRAVLAPAGSVFRLSDGEVIDIVATRLAAGELVVRTGGPQPWVYSQSTGRLTRNGRLVGLGYSGTGIGRNNPDAEDERNIGPIPRGDYFIGPAHDTATHGPHAMNLTPDGHNADGRDGFMIHGDNRRHDASTGCIILPPDVRHKISASGENHLEVVR